MILTQDVAPALGLRLAGEIDGRDQPGERLKEFVLLHRRIDPAVEYGGVAEAGGGEPVDAVHPARIAPVLRAVGFGDRSFAVGVDRPDVMDDRQGVKIRKRHSVQSFYETAVDGTSGFR